MRRKPWLALVVLTACGTKVSYVDVPTDVEYLALLLYDEDKENLQEILPLQPVDAPLEWPESEAPRWMILGFSDLSTTLQTETIPPWSETRLEECVNCLKEPSPTDELNQSTLSPPIWGTWLDRQPIQIDTPVLTAPWISEICRSDPEATGLECIQSSCNEITFEDRTVIFGDSTFNGGLRSAVWVSDDVLITAGALGNEERLESALFRVEDVRADGPIIRRLLPERNLIGSQSLAFDETYVYSPNLQFTETGTRSTVLRLAPDGTFVDEIEVPFRNRDKRGEIRVVGNLNSIYVFSRGGFVYQLSASSTRAVARDDWPNQVYSMTVAPNGDVALLLDKAVVRVRADGLETIELPEYIGTVSSRPRPRQDRMPMAFVNGDIVVDIPLAPPLRWNGNEWRTIDPWLPDFDTMAIADWNGRVLIGGITDEMRAGSGFLLERSQEDCLVDDQILVAILGWAVHPSGTWALGVTGVPGFVFGTEPHFIEIPWPSEE